MKNINNEELVGKAFEELSFEEMALDQGAADERITPTVTLVSTATQIISGAVSATVSIVASKKYC